MAISSTWASKEFAASTPLPASDLNTYVSNPLMRLYMVGGNSGTAFPTVPTPVTEDKFYRTDYLAWFVYKSAAWVQLTVGSMTAFPTSPAPVTGLRVFRSDRGKEYYYDGTRWLGMSVIIFPTNNYLASSQPFAANIQAYTGGMPAQQAIYFTSWRPTVYASSPNTGAAYWTISLVSRTGVAADVVHASFTTAALTADNQQRATEVTSFSSNPLANGNVFIRIHADKTGSPGSLYMAGWLEAREVG